MNKARKEALVTAIWQLGAIVVVSAITATCVSVVLEYRKRPAPEAAASVRQSTPKLGISCDGGKASFTTMRSGGFAITSAVIVDGQFVDCGMTYRVNGTEISALDVLQHGMNN